MPKIDEIQSDEVGAGERGRHQRPWWRRRNRLDLRNGELVVILLMALLAGLAVTFLTAYLGVR